MNNQVSAARKTALILALSQAIVGSAAPICFAIGALAGHYLLDADKTFATLPVTGFTLGVAIGAIPAAMIIRLLGQRLGFITGTIITGLGGAAAAFSLMANSFWPFVISLLAIGIGGAFVQQFRFAAADNAPPEFKARAISFVLAGGIITAIIGPQIVIFTKDLLAPIMFAGSFVAMIGIALVGGLLLSFLPRKTLVTAHHGGQDTEARPLGVIMSQPKFIVSLGCAVCSFSLMTFVMTGAPLAMVYCGFSSDQATLGISWHVMAMYAPSFFTGNLIQRFGAPAIVAAGLALLACCALIALSGIELWQFWSALILLGLGWNFGFIGATAMTAETYRPSEKAKVQGVHDMILFGSVAVASLMSGIILNAYGWEMMNMIVFPIVGLCALALVWLVLMGRQAADQRA